MAYRTSYGKSEWFNPNANWNKRFVLGEPLRQAAEYALQMCEKKHGKLPEHDFTRVDVETIEINGKREERARHLVFFKGDNPDKSRWGYRPQYEEVARFEIPNWDWVPTVRDETAPESVAA